MILRIGNVQFPVLKPDALRTAKALIVGRVTRAQVRGCGLKVVLADHYVGGRAADKRDGIPDQDAVVVGIGDGQDLAVRGN